MCQYMNEEDGVHAFLIARIAQLEYELEECQLNSIAARNPGINIEEVRKYRAQAKQSMEEN
jgi:hypothetical protein